MQNTAVIYRACNLETHGKDLNSCRPEWFCKMRCFKSFYNEFKSSDVDLYVVWDGEQNYLHDYIQSFDTKDIIHINKISNKESLLFCYDLAETISHQCEFLYFVEDDYIHRPCSYRVLMGGLQKFKDKGIVTLYDHLDRYISENDYTFKNESIYLIDNYYWRSSESTTGTSAMSVNIFHQVKQKMNECHVHDCLFYREILKQNIRLYNPIPGFSTHVNKHKFSPLIDWQKVSNDILL